MDGEPIDRIFAARLAALEDRAAITDLISAYALHAAAADAEAMVALFTDDGRFQAGSIEARGSANLRAMLTASLTPLKTMPMISNLLITVSGDTAQSACMMHTPWHDGRQGGFCGRYDDNYRRGASGWKFAQRIFTFYHGIPKEAADAPAP